MSAKPHQSWQCRGKFWCTSPGGETVWWSSVAQRLSGPAPTQLSNLFSLRGSISLLQQIWTAAFMQTDQWGLSSKLQLKLNRLLIKVKNLVMRWFEWETFWYTNSVYRSIIMGQLVLGWIRICAKIQFQDLHWGADMVPEFLLSQRFCNVCRFIKAGHHQFQICSFWTDWTWTWRKVYMYADVQLIDKLSEHQRQGELWTTGWKSKTS